MNFRPPLGLIPANALIMILLVFHLYCSVFIICFVLFLCSFLLFQCIGGVLPGFVTGIHKDSVRRWNLRFPSAGEFAKVLAGRATGTQITFPPMMMINTENIVQMSVSRIIQYGILLDDASVVQ